MSRVGSEITNLCYKLNMEIPAIISPELIEYIRKTYALHWEGLHGWSHWLRVCENGLHLAQKNGANQNVVALFAFTHDMARRSDGFDYQHGNRAAKRIQAELQGNFFHLSDLELAQLIQAVEDHTRGYTEADLTVQTCWDADRLDIGRAGIIPDPKRLCTLEAKEPATIEWAYQRSLNHK
jgi:uncharacterized protein